VTWRLAGTLPKLDRACRDGRTFVVRDDLLGRATTGPTWLRQPEIANCVVSCLRENAGGAYDLHAYVIMPNHVHVLLRLRPREQLATITRALKGKSARLSNVLLGRTGQPFWQDESFDHWIRHPQQFAKVKAYIEWNPVRAGLVTTPEQWPYSSAAGYGSQAEACATTLPDPTVRGPGNVGTG
jgi:putative transposase